MFNFRGRAEKKSVFPGRIRGQFCRRGGGQIRGKGGWAVPRGPPQTFLTMLRAGPGAGDPGPSKHGLRGDNDPGNNLDRESRGGRGGGGGMC